MINKKLSNNNYIEQGVKFTDYHIEAKSTHLLNEVIGNSVKITKVDYQLNLLNNKSNYISRYKLPSMKYSTNNRINTNLNINENDIEENKDINAPKRKELCLNYVFDHSNKNSFKNVTNNENKEVSNKKKSNKNTKVKNKINNKIDMKAIKKVKLVELKPIQNSNLVFNTISNKVSTIESNRYNKNNNFNIDMKEVDKVKCNNVNVPSNISSVRKTEYNDHKINVVKLIPVNPNNINSKRKEEKNILIMSENNNNSNSNKISSFNKNIDKYSSQRSNVSKIHLKVNSPIKNNNQIDKISKISEDSNDRVGTEYINEKNNDSKAKTINISTIEENNKNLINNSKANYNQTLLFNNNKNDSKLNSSKNQLNKLANKVQQAVHLDHNKQSEVEKYNLLQEAAIIKDNISVKNRSKIISKEENENLTQKKINYDLHSFTDLKVFLLENNMKQERLLESCIDDISINSLVENAKVYYKQIDDIDDENDNKDNLNMNTLFKTELVKKEDKRNTLLEDLRNSKVKDNDSNSNSNESDNSGNVNKLNDVKNNKINETETKRQDDLRNANKKKKRFCLLSCF